MSLQVPPYLLASSHNTNSPTAALATTPVSQWLQDSHHNLQDTLDWHHCLSRRPVTAQYLIHKICNSSSAANQLQSYSCWTLSFQSFLYNYLKQYTTGTRVTRGKQTGHKMLYSDAVCGLDCSLTRLTRLHPFLLFSIRTDADRSLQRRHHYSSCFSGWAPLAAAPGVACELWVLAVWWV